MPLPKLLPELLAARPKQEVVENLLNKQTRFSSKGRPSSYLISRCKACILDFSDASRLAQLTLEHCSDSEISLCPVIGSTDVVRCEALVLALIGERSSSSSITLDACKRIEIKLTALARSTIIYTSTSSPVTIRDAGFGDYEVPVGSGERMKTAWDMATSSWTTEPSNEYGDV